jgi:hypothetical protein
LLLPTEDLENDCLTALVGQIFSELIIGNLMINKLSEPWLLLEIFIILTRLGDKRSSRNSGQKESTGEEVPQVVPSRGRKNWSIHQAFWSLVQWGFLVVNSIRILVSTIVVSRSLPPRLSPSFVYKRDSTSSYDDELLSKSSESSDTISIRVPIADFKLWSCITNLLEVDARMPWLSGALSMLQWGATNGPGRFAKYDGLIDR